MPEQWLPVADSPGYEVSNQGRVRSLKRPAPRVLKLHVARPGYLYFFSYLDGGFKRRAVHTAVAEAFHGPRRHGQVCRHLDGDPLNNGAGNLRWGSQSENNLDQVAHGTHHNAAKTECPQGHPYDEANTYWLGSVRHCRTCNRAAVRRSRAKRAEQ